MSFKGPLAYDEKEFLKTYLSRRDRADSPNNAIEGPIMNRLIGNIEGAEILDLGCGDGRYGKELLQKGAKGFTGVEGSRAMFALASEELADTAAELHCTAIETYPFQENRFDFAVSRMVIHYIEDIASLFESVRSTLKENGKFIFSVQHPLTTSSFASKSSGERKGDWLVDDYFRQGAREEPWMGQKVLKFHRTVESYYSALIAAGFRIDALHEGEPVRGNFTSAEEYERRQRIPVVLIFSCRKIIKQNTDCK